MIGIQPMIEMPARATVLARRTRALAVSSEKRAIRRATIGAKTMIATGTNRALAMSTKAAATSTSS
jgi:hypothetical protein